MIPDFIRRLFILNYQYDNVIEQERAQRLLSIIGIFVIVTVFWIFLVTLPATGSGSTDLGEIIIPFVALGVTLFLHNLIQHGQVLLSSQMLIIFIFLISIPQAVNNINSPIAINLTLPLLLTGVLLGRRALAFATGLILLLFFASILLVDTDSGLIPLDAGNIIVVIALSSLFLGLFNSSLEQIARAASKIISQAQGLNQFGAYASDNPSQRQIITHAINLLRYELGFSYVRVVILDERNNPLQTFYSSIGVEQVAETTSFTFSNTGAFQKVIQTSNTTIINLEDPQNLTEHLLPSSNIGIIVPAQGFNQTIALFDIQTENTQELSKEIVTILNLFIAQVASNLIYQRTVRALREDISEQQVIINQQRQQIQNVLHQQTDGIVTDWENYLYQRGLDTIGYNIDNKRKISDLHMGDVPEQLRPAFETGDVVVQAQGDEQVITIPIRFRETVLGAMSFTVPKELPITERKLDFIRSVTERLALALDNKRLFEQTQTQAQRESTANEIGSILLSSTDVESVLRTAANHFNEALGAVTTQIYLQPNVLQPIENQQLEDTV